MRHEFDWFPVDRVIPVIEQFIEDWEKERPLRVTDNPFIGPIQYLKSKGIHERSLFRIRAREHDMVGIRLLDDLLVAMDKHHLFHVAPEDGGFADIYEHPAFESEEALDAYLRAVEEDRLRRVREQNEARKRRRNPYGNVVIREAA